MPPNGAFYSLLLVPLNAAPPVEIPKPLPPKWSRHATAADRQGLNLISRRRRLYMAGAQVWLYRGVQQTDRRTNGHRFRRLIILPLRRS